VVFSPEIHSPGIFFCFWIYFRHKVTPTPQSLVFPAKTVMTFLPLHIFLSIIAFSAIIARHSPTVLPFRLVSFIHPQCKLVLSFFPFLFLCPFSFHHDKHPHSFHHRFLWCSIYLPFRQRFSIITSSPSWFNVHGCFPPFCSRGILFMFLLFLIHSTQAYHTIHSRQLGWRFSALRLFILILQRSHGFLVFGDWSRFITCILAKTFFRK